MTGVLGIPMPGPDRPQKQADYAALSHPANTRTVMARTTVSEAVPLHKAGDTGRYPGAYYGGREAGAGYYYYK